MLRDTIVMCVRTIHLSIGDDLIRKLGKDEAAVDAFFSFLCFQQPPAEVLSDERRCRGKTGELRISPQGNATRNQGEHIVASDLG